MSKVTIQNPFNLQTIDELPLDSASTVEKYLNEADQIANDRSKWIPKDERVQILSKLKDLIGANRDSLIKQAASEGGKPFKDSVVEIDRGMNGVDVAIEEIRKIGGREIPMGVSASSKGRMAYTYYRPRGTVVAISAFNHPFNLIIHQVIPAVAAGCPVLVKPAPTTPLSCRSVVSLLHEAGLPEAYCRMVFCDNDVAEKMVTSPVNRFLTFIGSSGVGWYLRSKLPAGAECALEHGGAAPVIIDETADIDDAIPLLAKGGYYHAGQVCVSVQRIFVHETRKQEFLEKFHTEVKKLKTGDSLDPQTDVGPLILPKEVDRVHQWVDEALKKGAKKIEGGKKHSETVYEPTLLVDVPEDCTIAQKEVFGPVVLVQGFSDLKDAIRRANNVEYAFQASVFTKNLDAAFEVSQDLEGTAIMVNDHTAFRVDWMPFGGYKQSGLGFGGIGPSIHDMSLEKMVVYRSPVFN